MTTFHPGTSFARTLLLGESTLNILSGVSLIFYPSLFSSALFPTLAPSTLTSTNAIFQWFGVCTIGLAIPLALGHPDSLSGVVTRRAAYITTGAAEALFVPVLLWQVGKGTIDATAGYAMAGGLAGMLTWRVHCTFVKPEVLGYAGSLCCDEKKGQ
ncbi:hypothetical protein BDZ85DRAFT_282381 [Elsinoe ampelina]|uniref:Uncharacterized protein n=1 Tax=Elsinoe ampelina TaxID=302913 RepID=A0A6A6G963_9PEZI|nr:hypothetical protein BDZ85DRAFT_282381 [Elsinoe ampelina]